MRIVILTLLALSVISCGPSTIQGVRDDHTRKYEFEAPENYQAIYRKIVTAARQCFQTGHISAQTVVQSDLYTDTQAGNISVALHGGLGVSTYLAVDITAVDENRTKIVVYSGLSSWNSGIERVERWALIDSTSCKKVK